MSKRLSAEAFENLLGDDLVWRKAEIRALSTSLRRSISPGSRDSPLARALSRSLVTMLYAHWEGHVRHAVHCYARYLAGRGITVNTANDALVISHLARQLSRVQAGQDEARDQLLKSVRVEADPTLVIDVSTLTGRRANFRFEVLSEILGCVGAPTARFHTRKNLINTRICDERNRIAHGRESFPPPAGVLRLSVEVITLLEDLRQLLIEQVTNAQFLRPLTA